MKTILVKELETYPCEALFNEACTGKLEFQLQEKSNILKKELGLNEEPIQVAYNRSSRARTVKFSGIAGTISFGKFQIEIIPKFYETDDKWRESLFNIICIARSGRINPQYTSKIQQSRLNFYDHIGLMFADCMENALSHDSIQQYHTIESSSSFLRGRLLIGEQLKGLISHPGKLFYEQSILSDDNAFNFLLYWCNNTLSTLVINPEIKRRLLVLTSLIPKPETVYKIPVDMLLPPQYQYYRDAIRIANDLAIGISSSHQEAGKDGYGYVMAMSAVYEKFIERTLKQLSFSGHSMSVDSQVRSLFAVAQDSGMRSYYTIPDNKVSLDDHSLLLVDAKYKNNFIGATGKKPVNSDAYQIFSSLVSHDCRRGVLISPCDDGIQTCSKIWTISAYSKTYIIALILINLHDLSTNSAFIKLKHELENEILKVINY